MKQTIKKITMADRASLASQLAEFGISIGKIPEQNDEFRKVGASILTLAGAILNPFHLEELYRLIGDFNSKKITEEIAKRN